MSEPNLDKAAVRVVALLRNHRLKIGFAESCTGGLVSAALARIPGVSDCLYGSAVTYCDEAKTNWLGISTELIAKTSAVSDEVARAMAGGLLQSSGCCDLAASVTGHLGPGAPEHLDGTVFMAMEFAGHHHQIGAISQRISLISKDRVQRQIEAATSLMEFVSEQLER